MEKELITRLHKNFEDFVHNEDGVEFWCARDIQPLLAYTQWRNFEQVIQKAKTACQNAGNAVSDHFADVSKVIEAGKTKNSLSKPRSLSAKLEIRSPARGVAIARCSQA